MTVGESPVVLVVHDLFFFSFVTLCTFARARVFVDSVSSRGGRAPLFMQSGTDSCGTFLLEKISHLLPYPGISTHWH